MKTSVRTSRGRAAQSLSVSLVAAMLSFGAATAAVAQSDEAFYRGKQVKFVIGSAGAGGYEAYSRLITRTMSEHIPGHPLFIIQAMPGAGGIVSANYLYNIAARDGSELGMVGRAVGTQQLLDPNDQGPRYDAKKFNWIGSPESTVGLVIARQPSAIKRFADIQQHELIVSGTSAASPTSFYPRLFNNLLGTKFKVIDGYKSSQEALLAMERGEVAGHSSGSSAAPLRERIAPWLAEGKFAVIGQIGLEKDPAYPNAQLVTELATTTEQMQILELLLAQQLMAWPILAPPGVPESRVKLFRAAFDAAMKDSKMLAEADKQKLTFSPVSGERIAQLIEKVHATPKNILEKVAQLSAN